MTGTTEVENGEENRGDTNSLQREYATSSGGVTEDSSGGSGTPVAHAGSMVREPARFFFLSSLPAFASVRVYFIHQGSPPLCLPFLQPTTQGTLGVPHGESSVPVRRLVIFLSDVRIQLFHGSDGLVPRLVEHQHERDRFR